MTAPESPYGPTWYAATMVAVPERRALTHDLVVDVCVIGAGLAGLTVAREVARRGWSVAVLEARQVATGASGRNGGFVLPGFAERIDAIVDRVGLPRAKELWALSDAGVEYIRRQIAESEMPGVLPRDGRLSVRRIDDEQGALDHVAMLRVDFGADVEAWPTDQVREVLRSPHYFQGAHYPKAFHIHPLNYALGLAAAAEKDGARIFENTSALSLDPAGVRKRVSTARGMVRARHVVLAGSTGIGKVDEPIAKTVLPVSTYVAVTAPLGEKLFEAVRYTGAVADTRRAGDYYRIVSDDRLMWGGRISARASTPWRLKAALRHDILKVYPQLGEIEIDYAWSGVMAYAVHKMPQIGELGPGYWLASAFGGHGLNTTALAGEMIARAILEGDDRWRLFSPYELVWAGGKLGRAAAQMVFWSMQTRDALHEKIARYRDRARREADARQIRYEAERAARQAEAERMRAEEEARRIAEQEARRLAAVEAARAAAERARLAAEEAAREQREREHAIRLAAEKATREVADAAAALGRQIGEYRALTEPAAKPEGEGAPAVAAVESAPVAAAPAAAVPDAAAVLEPPTEPPGKKSRRGRKQKQAEKVEAGPAPEAGA
jgi:glycine/D-amino acid oxidase-like deaminating enzyme